MNWRQQLIHNSEKRLMEKIEMLNDCERERDLTDDIKKKKKLEIDISSLKQEINEISYEIEGFQEGSSPFNSHTRQALTTTMLDINLDDLTLVINAILTLPAPSTDILGDLFAPKPEEKMARNDLKGVRFEIEMGVGKYNEVNHIIQSFAKMSSSDFPDLLKGRFNAKYQELLECGFRGDDLFMRLWDFASCYNSNPRWRTAGLAILCYFFQLCDVFEP